MLLMCKLQGNGGRPMKRRTMKKRLSRVLAEVRRRFLRRRA